MYNQDEYNNGNINNQDGYNNGYMNNQDGYNNGYINNQDGYGNGYVNPVPGQPEKKSRFGLGVLVGALCAFFICSAVFTGALLFLGVPSFMGSTASSGNGAGGQDWNKIERKLENIQDYVDRYYIFDDRVDPVLQEEYIYKGYMAALGDVYSTYYTEEEWNDMEEQTSGSYVGIGVLVQQDKNTGLVTVMKVFSGSPAKEAGMLAGDILAQVGEVDATTMDLDMLVQNHIRGEEGTDVDITVFRPDSNEYIDMTITRKTVAVETVEAKINGDIGYISVSEFDGVSAGQFRSAIDTLQERGMKKLIVDMRNNPGGDVNTVIDMTDYLLDQNQVIFSMESKQGKERVFKSTDNHKVDIPIVVLVNSNSASAAEIFTGALQDHGAATIVGTTTFGKGIVQSVFELDDGSALKITTERYFTPNGRNIHEQGIEPDVVVELEGGNDYALSSMKEEEDNQLQKAMEILMAK